MYHQGHVKLLKVVRGHVILHEQSGTRQLSVQRSASVHVSAVRPDHDFQMSCFPHCIFVSLA